MMTTSMAGKQNENRSDECKLKLYFILWAVSNIWRSDNSKESKTIK